ncbi:MAG: hypothetical protein FJ291_06035 [Planctomycetes bacterium]|nr:hypothetical protein [Planctomycetota bacterium]
MDFWCLLLAIAIMAYIVAYTLLRDWVRARELRKLAKELGLSYGGRDWTTARLASKSPFVRARASWYYDMVSGNYQGHHVWVLDHREGFFTAGPARERAHDTCLVLEHEGSFPELSIRPRKRELVIDVMMPRLEEVEFESAEFSRSFRVATANRKFAYDVCHPRMMECLLGHRDLSVEFKGNSIAMVFQRHLGARDIPPRLNQLVEIRKLLPHYLFGGPSAGQG